MASKFIAMVVMCALLATAVEAERPLRDVICGIFQRQPEVTEIKDILENPESYSNKTVTVEGRLGEKTGYGWMRGDLWGVYDSENRGITISLVIDEEKYAREAGGDFAKYQRMIKEARERIEALEGKSVRVTGIIDTRYMKGNYSEDTPLLIFQDDDIAEL